MPERTDLKKAVKEPVKNLVKEVLGDIVYRIAKAGTKRAINELKQELTGKSLARLEKKLDKLSEQKLNQLIEDCTERLSREIAREGIEREDLIREFEQRFRQDLKEKLKALTKSPALKIATITTACVIVVCIVIYFGVYYLSGPGDESEARDTIPPEVIVRLMHQQPEPGQTVIFIAEAGDNVGLDWIELLVNGEIVETSGDSPCVFEGGPFPEGSTIRYSAYAYDEAGNRSWSGEQILRIAVSLRNPDLVIVEIWHEWIEDAGLCVIHYAIQNRGEEEAGASIVLLRYDFEVIGEDMVNSLKPGQTSEGEFKPVEMSTAGFEVELCVDGENVIRESNEDNNCRGYQVPGILQ